MEKRISVLIATYNHEKYIAECVSGCLVQLGHQDEILINDDGSSDRTVSIIQKFKDPRIQFGKTERMGPSAALNRLIQNSQGQYLSFISGDDRPTQNRLKSQLDFIEKAPAQTFGVSFPRLIDESGRSIPDRKHPLFFEERGAAPHQMFRELFFAGNFLCAPSWIGRRSEILHLPPFEHLSMQLQDFDYWIKALSKGYQIRISKERWVEYRVPAHQKHLSSEKNTQRMLFELKLIYENFFEFADENFMKVSFEADLQSKLKSEDFDKSLAAVYLFLMHPNPLIQRLGLERVYRLYENPVYRQHLKKNGISEQFFFEKGNEIQHSHLRAGDLLMLLKRKVDRKFFRTVKKFGKKDRYAKHPAQS